MIDEELFNKGYEHGYKSNRLTDINLHFKKSFREGFRKAKLEIRQYHKERGVLSFPIGRMKIKGTV